MPTTGTVLTRFDTFWKLTPMRNGRRVGKVKTLELFKRLSDDDQVLACRAAGIYGETYRKAATPGQFRPDPRDPERFLKNDWWRDWLEDGAQQCQFRSLGNPCEELARENDTHCQKHREYVAMIDRKRAELGLPITH